ncbi:hypothetical protein ABW19_dt0208827 [Dactylella cylindrospora]|nr:hypothetical protein ABW19_dt0208827 [Dactylella cylindrospora]
MAGAVEWSRNGGDNADTEQFAAEAQLKFTQQSDPDGLLKVPRHYIPVFVLHMFCKSERSRPFVLPDPERVAKIKTQLAAQKKLTPACPSWKLVSKTNDILDDETFIIFDTKTKRFDKFHWTECFKYDEPYQKFFEKFTSKEFTREGWKFQKFEKLQKVDLGILNGLWTNAYKVYGAMEIRQKESSDIIRLKRSDIWDLRKYLFLMTFLRNRDRNTHMLGTSELMVEAKEKRNKFMGVHSLNHPRDLWLHNASIMLDTPHHQISYHKLLFDLDQEDYRTNARERFMVFWEAGPNDEFILTDNSFGGMEIGRLEAKHTMPKKLKPSDLQKRLYSRDFMWHQIFVLSPKLAVALCHGTMINSMLTREHRDRYGLRLSLLDKLPHPVPQGYYKDLHIKECKFLKPEWKIPGEVEDLFGRAAEKGKYAANLDSRANNELEFMVSTLSSAQVGLVNMVLLQNQSITTAVESVVYRNPAALYRAIEEYSKHDWPIFTDEKQHNYKALKRKIFNQFNKPSNGHSSGKSSSGSSENGTRSSESSSRRSEKRVVIDDRKIPEPPKPVKKPETANPFYSDSESGDSDDDDDIPIPATNGIPERSPSPVPVKAADPPAKKEEPAAPPKPVEATPKSETSLPKSETPTPTASIVSEPSKDNSTPVSEQNSTSEPSATEKAAKEMAEELSKLEKEMADKRERLLREEQEAIEKLRKEREALEADIELKRKEELEASLRMERKKSERGGRPEDREKEKRERARSENRDRDDRVRATSTKSAGDRRRPRSKERTEAELVDVGKQFALLEVEREKIKRERQELEQLQQRRRREEEKETQKKIERMQTALAQLQRQLEEERHEKEVVKRMAAKEKELLKTSVESYARQTRELREAQERDKARAEVEQAARVEKERLERLEKDKQKELEKARERENRKRLEREKQMNEKAELERLQREREIQLEKDKEAERARKHRERELERATRSKARQSRYDLHERGSDISEDYDRGDPQALFRKNRMMLGAMSPVSDPGPGQLHMRYDEMTPPSSSHSHPDQFDDPRRFESMRSQSPPSPRLGYNYPPSPRRADTSPVPFGAAGNHRRGNPPKMLALEYESPSSSGFQTSPESPTPPLDLALYAPPPKEKPGRRKPEGHPREHHHHSRETLPRDPHSHPRDVHPREAHGRGSQPQVRRFETPAPLPNFNDLDHRLSKHQSQFAPPRDEYALARNGDRYPDDDYDEDDYADGYPPGGAMVRYERAPKKRLQIEAAPPVKAQHGRQKPPPRALPPPDYRNGR